MNKTNYEILNDYKKSSLQNRVRDTWVGLGSPVVTSYSRTFIKDMVYLVQLSTPGNPVVSELEGALIYCEATLSNSDPLDWVNALIDDETQGFFSFVNSILTPHFRLILTAVDVAAIVAPIDYNFVPYSMIELPPVITVPTVVVPDEFSDVIINDNELEIILTEVGVPFFQMEELEFSRGKILNNMVKPAMQEYFRFFPIVKPELYQNISYIGYNQFEIEVPQGSFGAVRAFVNQGSVGKNGAGASPFYFFATEIAGAGYGSNWSPNRNNSQNSPGYANLQGFGTMALDRAARQGMINYTTRFEFHIETRGAKRVLCGYSNKVGPVEVHWAYASPDWGNIQFDRLSEVRKLATAKVLRAIGMLRTLVKTDLPGALDASGYVSRAKELEDEVMKSWGDKPVVVIMRGSL